jgi:hypothetical protein
MSQTKGFRTANKRYMMIFVPMMTIYCVAITAALTLIDFDTSPTGLRAIAQLDGRHLEYDLLDVIEAKVRARRSA